MKLKKINYQIGCDVPGCKNISAYSLEFKVGEKVHLCSKCLEKLVKEYKRVNKNEKI